MAVTMKKIAGLAGVTRNVVSAVLNNTTGSRVSPAKRQRILEIAKELDFRPSFAAKALIKRRTGLLGLVCNDIRKPFFAELVVELVAEAERHGFMLLLLLKPLGREVSMDAVDKLVGDNMLDGLFLCGEVQSVADAVLAKANRCETPLVMLNSEVEGVSCVCFNLEAGMEKSFRLLIQNGHSGIAFAGAATDGNKRKAYRDCCSLFKTAPREFIYSETDVQSAMNQGLALAEAKDRPTALITTDYGISLMANNLAKKGVMVPGDLSVVAFNDTFQSVCFRPPLTSVPLDRALMARKAMDIMLHRLDSKGADGAESIVIEPEIVWRESVLPLLR